EFRRVLFRSNYAPAAAEAEEAVVRVSVATSCIANSLAQPPLGLTQAQVAALVGVSQRAVGMWEEEARVVSNRSTSNANTPIDNRGDGKQGRVPASGVNWVPAR